MVFLMAVSMRCTLLKCSLEGSRPVMAAHLWRSCVSVMVVHVCCLPGVSQNDHISHLLNKRVTAALSVSLRATDNSCENGCCATKPVTGIALARIS